MSVINTNITSLIGQQNLTESQNNLQTSLERLSSGLRINSAKDDAAGQAIANRFSAQITGLSQAQRNANDGISIAQTAEGGLDQVNENLQRIRELTVQAENGTNSDSDLDSIQDEINQRLSEIDRISQETDFNGTKVLSEEAGSLSIQVGADDGQTIEVGLRAINASELNLDGFNVNGSGERDNPNATVTDLTAAGATGTGNTRTLNVDNDAASLSQTLGELSDGDTVDLSGGAEYTFNADSDNFSFSDTAKSGDGLDEILNENQPNSGTNSGTFENDGGNVANFEVDGAGNITVDGEAAQLVDGQLTNNNTSGTFTQASLEDLFEAGSGGGSGSGATIDIGGTQYITADSGGTGIVNFTNTASQDEVLAAADNDEATVNLSNGLVNAEVEFNSGGESIATGDVQLFVDRNDELTTVDQFTTQFSIDPNSGEVTVDGTSEGGSFTAGDDFRGTNVPLAAGETVKVNSDGFLTTEATSDGERTEDPLATLDSALSQVDQVRGDLGAIQNRFESAITNLNTNEINLSAARSRIEDADYAAEVANQTKNQILQQAGTSTLAQANQIPQNVLSLLG